MTRPSLGIRSKLILIIALVIGLTFSVQAVFQNFLLEGFYLERLSRSLKQDIADLEESLNEIIIENNINNNIDNNDKVKTLLNDFRRATDQPIHIVNSRKLDSMYNFEDTEMASIAFKSDDSGEVLDIPVENYVIEQLLENSEILKESFYVSGYSNEELDAFALEQLKSETQTLFSEAYESELYPLDIYLDEYDLDKTEDSYMDYDWEFTEMSGRIIYYKLGSIYSAEYELSDSVLQGHIDEMVFTGALKDIEDYNFQSSTYFDKMSNSNQLVIFKKLQLDVEQNNTSPSYFMFSIIPYASFQEALEIYSDYSWIALLVASVVAFILIILFSGRIVRPIRDMERVSSKMAELNFDERLQVASNDEIGQLANSFNTLSQRLQSSIESMKSLNDDLSLEVEERSKQQAILKAFIGNASHELKTPITIMKGLMDGVEDGIYDANSSEHKTSIQDEVSRMEKIVYDLLQVSKMERGAQTLQKVVFDPSDIIYSTYQRHKRRALNNNIVFKFDFEDVFVVADQSLIESVIDNLISNAINYSASDAEVICSIKSKANQAVIAIENTGVFIPSNDLEKVFDPFFRVDKSHTRSTGGSGLGLSIIKNILDLHSSEFSICNTDLGVKFEFILSRIGDEH